MKAKEVLKTFFLFNRPDIAEKVLATYPFPEHFNDIFELFVNHGYGGTLAFPYMSYVWCVRKQDVYKSEIDTKEELSAREFVEYFYAAPWENLDLFYFDAKGTKNGFKVCFCLVKKCFITSFYNIEVEQASYLGMESKSVAELQTIHLFQHWKVVDKLGELFDVILHGWVNQKEKVYEIFDLLKLALNK